MFLSLVATRYSSQNYRNYYYRKESYVPVLMERVRDCFANCLCVAMEEGHEVDVARKSVEFTFFVRTLQRCSRLQFWVAQHPRIAILHDIWRNLQYRETSLFVQV